MKYLRVLNNSIKDSFKSVFRNMNLSISSVVCTTITLVLVSIAIILSTNINTLTREFKEELNITVIMDNNATLEQADILGQKIKILSNISKDEGAIEFMTKEDVKKYAQLQSEDFNLIMSNWNEEDNPFGHQYIVKVKDQSIISETAKTIKEMDNVYNVKYGENQVDKLVNIFSAVEKTSLILVAALIIVTIFLISNTIKITIFSRKSEIEIMRLIGTSNTAIRLPFLFEGFILGVLGALIPIAFTVYGYIFMYDKLNGKLFYDILTLIEPSGYVIYISLIILGIGSIVGMIGSYRSVRKYLKI